MDDQSDGIRCVGRLSQLQTCENRCGFIGGCRFLDPLVSNVKCMYYIIIYVSKGRDRLEQ